MKKKSPQWFYSRVGKEVELYDEEGFVGVISIKNREQAAWLHEGQNLTIKYRFKSKT